MSTQVREPTQADIDSGRFKFLLDFLDKTLFLPQVIVNALADIDAAEADIVTLESAVTALNTRIASPVANVAALKALDTTSATTWPDKIAAYVEAEKKFFALDRDSAAPEDLGPPIEVVAPTAGVGRWIVLEGTVGTEDIRDLAVTVAKCAAATLQAGNHTLADAAGKYPTLAGKTVEAGFTALNSYQGVVEGWYDLDGSPPAAPVAGQKFIADTTAGLFTETYIYIYNGSTYDEIVPVAGDLCVGINDGAGDGVEFYKAQIFDGTEWKNAAAVSDNAVLTYIVDGFADLDGAPPGGPSHSDLWIDDTGAGAFTAGNIYKYDGTLADWVLALEPDEGAVAYYDGDIYRYDGSAWGCLTSEDRAASLAILSFFDNSVALPVGPSEGDRYIATATANGWTADRIYTYLGTQWLTQSVNGGDVVYNVATALRYLYSGGSWNAMTADRFETKEITILIGAASGASGADANWISGTVIGCVPVSGNDQTIVSAAIDGAGACTVTVGGNETAEAKFNVTAKLA